MSAPLQTRTGHMQATSWTSPWGARRWSIHVGQLVGGNRGSERRAWCHRSPHRSRLRARSRSVTSVPSPLLKTTANVGQKPDATGKQGRARPAEESCVGRLPRPGATAKQSRVRHELGVQDVAAPGTFARQSLRGLPVRAKGKERKKEKEKGKEKGRPAGAPLPLANGEHCL